MVIIIIIIRGTDHDTPSSEKAHTTLKVTEKDTSMPLYLCISRLSHNAFRTVCNTDDVHFQDNDYRLASEFKGINCNKIGNTYYVFGIT